MRDVEYWLLEQAETVAERSRLQEVGLRQAGMGGQTIRYFHMADGVERLCLGGEQSDENGPYWGQDIWAGRQEEGLGSPLKFPLLPLTRCYTW